MVITATASDRRPPSQSWACSRIGHVATASIVAQANATRNGRMTQKLVVIKIPRMSSCRTVRAWSDERVAGISTSRGSRSEPRIGCGAPVGCHSQRLCHALGGSKYSVTAKIRYTASTNTPLNQAARPLVDTTKAVRVAISIITTAPGQNCRFIGDGPTT